MNLYLIKRTGTVRYDENAAHVIRAISPSSVRRLAANAHKDESPDVWLDTTFSTVQLLALGVRGDDEIVLTDRLNG